MNSIFDKNKSLYIYRTNRNKNTLTKGKPARKFHVKDVVFIAHTP